MIRRFIPGRLASQLLVLLLFALLLAFLAAVLVTVNAQRQNDRATRDTLVVERVQELVTTIEALATDSRSQFAKQSGTRTTSIKVESSPAVHVTASNERSVSMANQIAVTIGRDVRASVLSRNEFETSGDPRDAGRNREVIAVSVPLQLDAWLNYSFRQPLTWYTRTDRQFLLFAFGLSMISVLGVAWFFVRRLTQPVEAIAAAAKRAAKGDREARIPVVGPEEFREAAQAFNSMQAHIAQFESERTRTIAAVGHDLRTPITSLRVRAEMIEDIELREPMIKTLSDITSMADGLVAYARSRQEEEFEKQLDLYGLVKSVAAEFDVPFESRTQPRVTGGPVSLSRAIRNLIDNAGRYGTDVCVSLETDGSNAIVNVTDKGPGIDPEQLKTIFSPFVRGESSRSSSTGGHGLGLTISQEIIRSHGGDIALTNRDRGGLHVTVSIPLS